MNSRRDFCKKVGGALLFSLLPRQLLSSPAGKMPNIFYITIDTLRRDHVGSFGYSRPSTPHVDLFRKGATLFENAFANSSWTMPSYFSLLTGLNPGIHQVVSYECCLPDHITTFPQILRKEGYKTGAIISNPTMDSSFGFNRGFDYYDDFSIILGKEVNLFDEDDTQTTAGASKTSDQVTNLGVKWIKNNAKKDKPVFMMLNYLDPHTTYLSHKPEIDFFEKSYDGMVEGKSNNIKPGMSKKDLDHILALYDSEIRYTDKHVGIFIDYLKKAELFDDSIVLFASDHGEEFLDHGGSAHGHTLFNELVSTPLMIKLPKNASTKKQNNIAYNVSFADIMPTFLDLLGIEVPPLLSGESFWSGTGFKKEMGSREIYLETSINNNDLRAIVKDKTKIIIDNKTSQWNVFDLLDDPLEKRGLKVADFKSLQKRLTQYTARINNMKAPPKPKQNSEILKQLKALGYL